MRHIPNELMIFAAGLGTRMGALTADRPKPLIDVAGRPLINHALEIAEGVPLARTVVNTHYLAHQMAEALADRDIRISEETPDLLDTGGGLKHALNMFEGPAVFTLNSDAVWQGPNPLARLAAAWDPDKMDALLLVVDLDRVFGRKGGGDFTLTAGGPLKRGGRYVYTGAQIIKTATVGEIADRIFSLNRVWDVANKNGRLIGIDYPGSWCDVGHPGGIVEAESMLASV